MDLLVVTRS